MSSNSKSLTWHQRTYRPKLPFQPFLSLCLIAPGHFYSVILLCHLSLHRKCVLINVNNTHFLISLSTPGFGDHHHCSFTTNETSFFSPPKFIFLPLTMVYPILLYHQSTSLLSEFSFDFHYILQIQDCLSTSLSFSAKSMPGVQ